MTVAEETTTQLGANLDELSRLLYKQRELIGLLGYRLEVQQLLLTAARADRLQLALDDVETVMSEIRRVERNRDLVVRECAQAMGLPDTTTLSMLKEHAPEPWSSAFAEHQAALLGLVAATESTAATNREFAQRGMVETRAILNEITGSEMVTGYGPNAARSAGGLSRPALLDREA